MSPSKLIIVYIFCVASSSLAYGRPERKESKWMNSLLKYITENLGKHQVVFLIDEKSREQTKEIRTFVQKVSSNVPTFTTTIDHAINSNKIFLSKHITLNPRATTLFALILDSLNKVEFYPRLKESFKFLSKLSSKNARPKCLIVHFLKGRQCIYENMTRKLALQKFVDVTILEVSESEFSPKNKVSKKFSVQKRQVVSVYHFNPYSQIYIKQKSLKKLQWFPDKGKNMYMKEMKILIKKKHSMNETFLRLLSSKLNFSVKFINAKRKSNETFFRLLSSKLNFSVKFINAEKKWNVLLRQNKGQFFLQPVQYFHTASQKLEHISRVMYLESINVLVPNIPIPLEISANTWRTIRVLFGNAAVLVALRFLLSTFKFNNDFWQMMNIMGVVLGMGLSTVPKTVKDRIVFICFLVTCMVYSGELHSMLTNMELRPIPIKEINTIKDLAMSGLPLYTTAVFLTNNKIDENDPDYLNLLRKRSYHYRSKSIDDCISNLVMYKNLTCSLSLRNIDGLLKNLLKKNKKFELKVVDESLSYVAVVFMLERGAPYIDNFNKEVLKMIEVGFMSKMGNYQSYKPVIINPRLNELNTSSNAFRRQILSIVVAGYVLALIVFILEHLCCYLERRKNKVRRFEIPKERKHRWITFRTWIVNKLVPKSRK